MLLVGMGGLNAEVCKNVVLAGVKSMVLLDHRDVTPLDACSQFFVSRDDMGKNVSISILILCIKFKSAHTSTQASLHMFV